ncbi:MAG: hypothetical protein R3Y63_13830 [Eubacteriales bacterium]
MKKININKYCEKIHKCAIATKTRATTAISNSRGDQNVSTAIFS